MDQRCVVDSVVLTELSWTNLLTRTKSRALKSWPFSPSCQRRDLVCPSPPRRRKCLEAPRLPSDTSLGTHPWPQHRLWTTAHATRMSGAGHVHNMVKNNGGCRTGSEGIQLTDIANVIGQGYTGVLPNVCNSTILNIQQHRIHTKALIYIYIYIYITLNTRRLWFCGTYIFRALFIFWLVIVIFLSLHVFPESSENQHLDQTKSMLHFNSDEHLMKILHTFSIALLCWTTGHRQVKIKYCLITLKAKCWQHYSYIILNNIFLNQHPFLWSACQTLQFGTERSYLWSIQYIIIPIFFGCCYQRCRITTRTCVKEGGA